MNVLDRIATTFIRCGTNQFRRCLTAVNPRNQRRSYAIEEKPANEETDKPIEFSTSKAAKWKSRYTFSGEPPAVPVPEIQQFSVVFSVAAFMVYFCILREENDIDEMLYAPPTDRTTPVPVDESTQ